MTRVSAASVAGTLRSVLIVCRCLLVPAFGIQRPAAVTAVIQETDESTREPGVNPGGPLGTRRAAPPATAAAFSRSRNRFASCGSELDIEFVDLVGFLPGGCDPLLHFWQRVRIVWQSAAETSSSCTS